MIRDIIEDRRAQRDRVLVAVYQLTGGDLIQSAPPPDLATATNLTDADVETARRWLIGQGLLESRTAAGAVSLTPLGSDRAEELLAGGQAAAASVTLSPEWRPVLERFVYEVRRALDSASLEGDDRADAEAQLATIEAQARSPRPRRDVIGGAIKGLKISAGWALQGVIGGAAFSGLLALMPG